ncbi:MAG: hypothetical protein ACRBFS_13545 [Aureispira sp.]
MLPFVGDSTIMEFVNRELATYFLQEQEFQPNQSTVGIYDVKRVWYLFALLVYAEEIQTTVVLIWQRMKAVKNPDISLIRRILMRCSNSVYQSLEQEVALYFAQQNPQTKVYQWLQKHPIEPPTTIDWNFVFRLQTKPNPASATAPLFLMVSAHAPKGDGLSFKIQLTDQNYNIYGTWNDFSTQSFIKVGLAKKQLFLVPELDNLKELLTKLEEIFELEFDKNYHFQYFSKGFKKKTSIQKWLLEA